MGCRTKTTCSLALFLLVVTLSPVVFSQKVDVLCLLEHCGVQMYECVANTTCRDALTCFGGCGANLTCTMQCLYSYGTALKAYEDRQFNNFFLCATVQHTCLTVTPSFFNCTKPQQLAQNFTFNMLKGQWYSVRGMTPPTDCYGCSSFLYEPYQHGFVLRNTFDANVANGKTRRIKIQLIEEPTTSPAIWKSVGSAAGVKGLMEVNEEWRAVALTTSGDTFLTYFCGNSTGSGYEGVMLFSRSQNLTSAEY
ncbi:uncharacterized protein [Branchiostoma lanceolatum]|uniref:uncharacterized protein n=1 Tax=Branchiostoma lanceolatum TaxID=7740 RepID=UPI0034570B58